MKPPVIIVPGIQGTKLANINKKDFDTVWSGIRKFFDNLYDLTLLKDGRTEEKEEVIIERKDVEDLAYSEIINYFKNRGYPVYIFGYDWRKSNLDTGQQLLDFVKVVRKKHRNNAKINFVTHSMGCLVFSGFMRLISDYQKKTFINRVVFTVPPFKGSVEAVYNLIIGKSKLFNSSDDFRKIARTFPAIFELCPVYEGAVRKSNNQPFNIFDYREWQQDPSHRNYSNIREQFETRLVHLQSARSNSNLIFDFNELSSELKNRMLVVAGTNEETQQYFKIKTSSEYPLNEFEFDEAFANDEGDGTVHLDSAKVFKDSIRTLAVKSRWIEKRLDGRLIMADWHAFFLNNGRVQNVIKRFMETESNNLQGNWFESKGGGVKKVV